MEIVRIKNIEELKKRKFKPADFQKKFIDEEGQEYKIRFDSVNNKIKIVKIVKAVLDGSFIKTRYDSIAKDEDIKEAFKDKFTELGKDFVERVKKEEDDDTDKKNNGVITSSDDIELNTFSDVIQVLNKIKERKDLILDLINKSNVLNGKFDYEDELLLREIRRLIETDIINEFDLSVEKYNDVLNGIYDSQVKLKLYNDEIRAKIEKLSDEDRLKILREYYAIESFLNSMEHILKVFDDINFKLENLPQSKLDVRNHTERQMFKDAIFTLDTCKSDAENIYEYLKNKEKKLFGEL